MWMMNVKKIFSYIGAFFIGIGSTVLYFLLHNRRTDGSVEERIRDSRESIENVEQSIDKCTESIADSKQSIAEIGQSIDGIQETVSNVTESIERSRKIFEEIQNQKLD